MRHLFMVTVIVKQYLRYGYWKLRLKELGSGVVFYSRIVIHSPEKVSIGDNARIGDGVLIWGGARLKLGPTR